MYVCLYHHDLNIFANDVPWSVIVQQPVTYVCSGADPGFEKGGGGGGGSI